MASTRRCFMVVAGAVVIATTAGCSPAAEVGSAPRIEAASEVEAAQVEIDNIGGLAQTPDSQEFTDSPCVEDQATFGGAARLRFRMSNGGTRLCSGVLISDKAVLTSAACFNETVSGTTLFNLNSVAINIHLQRQNSTITPCITLSSDTNQCGDRLFQVLKHGSYTPNNKDNQDNIAIAYIKSNKMRYKDRDIPSSDMARLYADILQKSENQIATGFGACNFQGDGFGEYGELFRHVFSENIFDHHYRFKVSNLGETACIGDFGGAAFLSTAPSATPIVVGLLSSFEVTFANNICGGNGLFERYTKISPKVTWISNSLQTLTGKGCRPPFQQSGDVKYQLCFD